MGTAQWTVRRLHPGDLPVVLERTLASFGAHQDTDEVERRLAGRLRQGTVLGAVDADDRVVSHATVTTVDHWMGGQRVPCQHVAGVAVAPEDRGRGAAGALLRRIVSEGAAAGLGVSLLFPAVDGPYRPLGWEHAGVYARWRLACRAAAGVHGPRLRRLDRVADWPAVRGCHERFGARHPCLEVRGDERWRQLAEARFAWGHDAGGGGLGAYALVDHEPISGDWRHRLALRDWAATSPDGLSALVAFVGRHGSTAAEATLKGPVPHPWAQVLPEQDLQLVSQFAWMARGLHLPTAFACRGVPAALRASVILAVDDPLLPAAGGPWRLRVEHGRARLDPCGAEPDVRLEAAAIGPLLTGHRTAEQLALGGLAHGDPEALATLSAVLAGPLPTLTDFF